MKKVGSFCKIFSSFIFFFYFFSSCETTLAQSSYAGNGCGGVILKATRNIRIQNDGSDKIKLIDEVGCPAYILSVFPDQNVEWEIDGSVKSIDSIVTKPKPGNGNVFEEHPHKKFRSKRHWKGKIKSAGGADNIKNEEYYIVWTAEDGTQHTYDPLIQLNPKFNLAPKK